MAVCEPHARNRAMILPKANLSSLSHFLNLTEKLGRQFEERAVVLNGLTWPPSSVAQSVFCHISLAGQSGNRTGEVL